MKIRFQSKYDSNKLFVTSKSRIVGEFDNIRSHIYAIEWEFLKGKIDLMDNNSTGINHFYVGMGHKDYQFNYRRLVFIQFRTSISKNFRIRSNSFYSIKLASPYKDHCFDYKSKKMIDWLDAIAKCGSNRTHSSYRTIAWKRLYNTSDLRTKQYDGENCPESKFKVDCDEKIYVIRVTITDTLIRNPEITFGKDYDVSFVVISMPRIDTISYITYILGAMGSWIGFSFVAINPIPYFFKHGSDH